MKQRDITPYNIVKKIVPARKMVGEIARVKIPDYRKFTVVY
jgi:hypothetical protein